VDRRQVDAVADQNQHIPGILQGSLRVIQSILKALIGFALIAPTAVQAADGDLQTWNTLNLNTTVAKNVPVTLEFGARMVDDAGRLGVLIFRPSIGYKISDDLTVSLGYAHFKTINRGRADTDENRIYQQVTWRIGKIDKATLIARSRLEQRWIEGARDMGWRLTGRLRLQVPLKAKQTNLILSHEQLYALNSTDWGARAGLDQMRNYVGVSFPISKGVTLETGYQNRYLVRRGTADRIDHIVPIILNVNF
jgi:Protein of unknown function (DUF2490)